MQILQTSQRIEESQREKELKFLPLLALEFFIRTLAKLDLTDLHNPSINAHTKYLFVFSFADKKGFYEKRDLLEHSFKPRDF